MVRARHMKQGNVAAIMLGLTCAGLLFIWHDYSQRAERDAEELRRLQALPDRWYVVRNVAVPNFIEGTDPLITYSREIRQPFYGMWSSEVHLVSATDDFPTCTGSGQNFYEPNETLPDAGVRLSWFLGKDCELGPGKYVIDSLWRIEPEGYPPKTLRFTSNPFTVIPKGGQLYVTPKQAEQLDNTWTPPAQ